MKHFSIYLLLSFCYLISNAQDKLGVFGGIAFPIELQHYNSTKKWMGNPSTFVSINTNKRLGTKFQIGFAIDYLNIRMSRMQDLSNSQQQFQQHKSSMLAISPSVAYYKPLNKSIIAIGIGISGGHYLTKSYYTQDRYSMSDSLFNYNMVKLTGNTFWTSLNLHTEYVIGCGITFGYEFRYFGQPFSLSNSQKTKVGLNLFKIGYQLKLTKKYENK